MGSNSSYIGYILDHIHGFLCTNVMLLTLQYDEIFNLHE